MTTTNNQYSMPKFVYTLKTKIGRECDLDPRTPNFVQTILSTDVEIDHDNIRVTISIKLLFFFQRFYEYTEQIF